MVWFQRNYHKQGLALISSLILVNAYGHPSQINAVFSGVITITITTLMKGFFLPGNVKEAFMIVY